MSDQEQTSRKRGRPRTYASAADRAKAWRQRQRDLIAKAQQSAEPIIIEKVVEKIVEIPVTVPQPMPRPSRATKSAKTPRADKLAPLLKTKLNGYGGEERAKALRINAARAATTARDILRLFEDWENVPETERAFLRQAAQFFSELNTVFEAKQHTAKAAKAKADAEFARKREAELAETIRLTFGDTLDPAQVIATAQALERFVSEPVRTANAKRRGVDHYYFFIARTYEFRQALKTENIPRLAREIAEIRMETGERGRLWRDTMREENCYSAGWADFVAFRTHEKEQT